MAKTPNVSLNVQNSRGRDQLRIDPLSQVFLAMRVKNSKCVRLELAGTWGFRFEGYDHAHFGVISQGSCWLSIDEGGKPIRLGPGDCWLLPQGTPTRYETNDRICAPIQRNSTQENRRCCSPWQRNKFDHHHCRKLHV